MVDLKLGSDGDLVFENGDLVTVDGVEEFEQRLREWVQSRSSEIIGEIQKPENAMDRLQVQAERIVQDYDHISRLVDMSATRINPGTYEVEIKYEVSGESRFYSLIAQE